MELRRYLDPRATWRDTSEVDKVRLYTRQSFLWIVVTFSFAGLLEAVAREAWISAPAMIVSAGAGMLVLLRTPEIGGTLAGPIRWTLAVAIGAGILAGLAGGIHALFVSYVTAGETFNITVPLTVVLMSVLGGTRHWAGPAVGALAITALLYSFTAGDHAVAGKAAVGAILVVVILFMPEGILGWVLKKRKKAR